MVNEVGAAFVITRMGTASGILEITQRHGGVGGAIFLGRGTAKGSLLDMLGLGKDREYEILLADIPKNNERHIIGEISEAMEIEKPGHGIIFIVPAIGIAGLSILRQVMEKRGFRKNAESVDSSESNSDETNRETARMDEFEFSMIVTIVKRGFADEAMEAAREAGAMGGIVLHARSGLDPQKFLGITIEDERDVLINVVDKAALNGILTALVERSGMKTEARGMSFVLPVSRACGVVRRGE